MMNEVWKGYLGHVTDASDCLFADSSNMFRNILSSVADNTAKIQTDNVGVVK
jgi:hypothetical protein